MTYHEIDILIKYGFFPATPQRPKIAFQFQLLDLLETLVLECQLAIKDFITALNYLAISPLLVNSNM